MITYNRGHLRIVDLPQIRQWARECPPAVPGLSVKCVLFSQLTLKQDEKPNETKTPKWLQTAYGSALAR